MEIIEDRFYRGFVAGVIGGIVASTLSHISYFLGITSLRISDWAALLMFAHEPSFSLGEHLFSVFIYISFCGAVGSVFAYFLLLVNSRHLFLKAWVLGTVPYFVFYLLTTLFQVPGTVPLPFATALSNYITSSIFSIVMGYSFHMLNQETIQHLNSQSFLAQPASKPVEEDKMGHLPNSDEGDRT